MKNAKMRLEEYVTGATFLLTSFRRDRKEMEKMFKEFTEEYLSDFEKQLDKISKLDSILVKTMKQEQVTKDLYAAAKETTKDLEFLAYYLKRAKLGVTSLSSLRADLRNGNIEGACRKLEDVVQYLQSNSAVLESHGLNGDYYQELIRQKDELGRLNALQDEYINARIKLTATNRAEYKALYSFISTIAEAGKIYFDGQKEENEYTIARLISRMRSPNEGGGKKK